MSATDTPATGHILKALAGLMLALFVSTTSSTVVTTALPQMLHALHGSQTQYTWVVTATLLTATAAIPIWGKLADLFSKQQLLQVAALVFIAGSVAAGLSQSAGELIAARALQGVGVGGLQALVQITLAAMIPPRERGRYAGYTSSATAISTIGGPLLGGFIVDNSWLGWRWCFFIGIPFAILALILVQRTIRLPLTRRGDVKIDYGGATLITGSVSVLLIWVSFVGGSFAWASWQTAVMIGATLLLAACAVRTESRAAEPIVPPRIIRQRTTMLAVLGSLAAGTAMYGASVFLTQYFQISRDRTPAQAGLLTIPMMAGILIASTVAGALITRTGRLRPYLIAGTVSLAAGFGGLSLINDRTPLVFIGVAMVLVGAGVGMTVQNFVLVVQNSVPLSDIGASSATVSFFRSMGGTIGVAVLGAVLARQVSTGIAGGAAAQAAYGSATGHIFAISAAVALVGVLAAVLLKPVTLRSSLQPADPAKEPAAVAGAADAVKLGSLVHPSHASRVSDESGRRIGSAMA